MHLEKPIVPMHLHIAAKKRRQSGEGFIVHFVGGVTRIVLFADIDIGDKTGTFLHIILHQR
ncbi:hypothetical protein D3C87_1664260 [compost metagenome]